MGHHHLGRHELGSRSHDGHTHLGGAAFALNLVDRRTTHPKVLPAGLTREDPAERWEVPVPAAEPVTREELEAVKMDLAELRTEFTRFKSETEHEMSSSFDGMARQLPAMIEGVVVSKFNIVNLKLDALILKASEAEKYRAIREEVEKDVAAKQGINLDYEIKRTELKTRQIALDDLPKASVFARQRIVWGGVSAFVLALFGLVAAAIASHK